MIIFDCNILNLDYKYNHMNLITADFNWISFALVIIAGIIGMIKSNTRKSECPSASLAPESCEEEEMKEKCFYEEEWEKTEDIQVLKANNSSEEIVLKEKTPVCFPGEEDKEEHHSQFDIRQAIISSEILKRPEF